MGLNRCGWQSPWKPSAREPATSSVSINKRNIARLMIIGRRIVDFDTCRENIMVKYVSRKRKPLRLRMTAAQGDKDPT